MLNTIGDFFTEVLVRNNRTTTDGFITDQILQDWARQAITFVASYRKWPATEGRVSTTFASLTTNEDGYLVMSYPEGWKTDSIRVFTVGGKQLDKKVFHQFRKFLEDYSGDTDRICSDYGRQVLINPSIDVSGTVTAWGQYSPFVDVTDTAATTPFSGNEEEANEAIVEKMTSFLKLREHLLEEANVHDQRATMKLDALWQRIQDEQYAYQAPKGDYGMFGRIDVLEGNYEDELNSNQWQ